MIYIIISILIVLIISIIYKKYENSLNPQKAFLSIAFLILLLVFTYFSKVIMIHKALLVLHIIFLLISYLALFRYIFKDLLNVYLILLPSLTIVAFIVIAFYIKANG
jgi:hypothetical protein